MFQANMDYCKGITCGLSWVVIVIAVIIMYVTQRPPMLVGTN
jgi:hypothetical protein